MELSKYFRLEEFEHSDTAKQKGIVNKIPDYYIPNVVRLHDNILFPLRNAVGCPVRITSGFRCEKINQILGGAKNSQHCSAQAVDISVVGQSNLAVFNWIRKNSNFDQLILEQIGSIQWVHVSFRFNNNRKQCLSYDGHCYRAI